MAVAVEKVHRRNGPWIANQGYEYNAVLMAAVFAITAAGPGPWSLDHALGIGRSGDGVALAQLAAGVAGAAAVIALGARGGEEPPAEPEAQEGVTEQAAEQPAPAS